MGRVVRSLKTGLRSLMLHKLRSGLTVLGIVFGVAAVIAMLAIGEGSSREAQARFLALGASNVIFRSIKPSEESQAATSGGRRTILTYGLKYDDFDRILATVPTIEKALAIREIRKEVRRGNHSLDARLVGTTAEYSDFNQIRMIRGRFLTDRDNRRYANYAVLAWGVAKTLFPYEDPIGQAVKVGSDFYTVIGVTDQRATQGGIGGSLGAQDFNKDVYLPMNTCRLRLGDKIIEERSGSRSAEEIQLTQITVKIRSTDLVKPSVPILERAVLPYHPKKDVDPIIPLELLEEAQRTARQWSFVLGTIASISLLVGGIGIMNIMLATVTERTLEIGIRRALGAKRKDITQQFLIESVVLSGVGGLLGVAIGIGLPAVIVYFAKTRADVTLSSVLLSFGISVAVGVVFGLYPARRAALMDPIEALRHE